MIHRLIIAGILILSVVACNDSDVKSPEEMAQDSLDNYYKEQLTLKQQDSIHRLEMENKYDTLFPKINYKKIKIEDYGQLKEIREKYKRTKENFPAYKTLITLNRQELGHIGVGEEIIVPDTIIDDIRAYSVFPLYYHGAKDLPKLIMVSNDMQAYACYENGVQVRFAAVNSGKEKTPTFPGRYALVWRERVHRSSLDSNWKMPFTWNFHPHAGNAFHQFDMPGRPVSHSCVRQFMDDAEWLYYWGEGAKRDTNGKMIRFSGTPVIIMDIFDFSRDKGGPWLDLTSNKDSIREMPEDPMEVKEALIPLIQIPKSTRSYYTDRPEFVHAEDTLRARGIIREGVVLTPSVNHNERRRKEAAAKARAEKKKKEEEERKRRELEQLNPDNNAPSNIEANDPEKRKDREDSKDESEKKVFGPQMNMDNSSSSINSNSDKKKKDEKEKKLPELNQDKRNDRNSDNDEEYEDIPVAKEPSSIKKLNKSKEEENKPE